MLTDQLLQRQEFQWYTVFELWKISWGRLNFLTVGDRRKLWCESYVYIQYLADPLYIIWQCVRGIENTAGGGVQLPQPPAIQTLMIHTLMVYRGSSHKNVKIICLVTRPVERVGVGGGLATPIPATFGCPAVGQKYKYARMYHFEKKNPKFFSIEGPRENVWGPARMFPQAPLWLSRATCICCNIFNNDNRYYKLI